MIGDSQLAEYLEGDMEAETRQRFEAAAADDDKLIAQIVAQQRIHHALQFLNFAGTDPHHPHANPTLKQAIMKMACGNEPNGAKANLEVPTEAGPRKVEPGVIIAAVVLFLMVLLSAALWHFAPQP